MLIGAAIALMVVLKVELGFVVLAFITHSNLSTVLIEQHDFFSIAKVLVVLIAIGIIIRHSLQSSVPSGLAPIVILITFYGLAGIVSLLVADYPDEGFQPLLDLVKDSLIAIIAVVLVRRYQLLRAVFWALIISGAFLGTIAVIQYVTGTFDNNYWGLSLAPIEHILGEIDDHRQAGTLGDPNFFALFQFVLLPLAIDRFFSEKNQLLKLFAAYATGMIFFSVILTYSRGGFLGMLTMVLILVILKRNLIWQVGVLSIVFFCVILYLPQSNYIQRMFTLEYFSLDKKRKPMSEAAFSGRKSEMLAAAKIFLDNPITGVGVGNYERNYHEYARELYIDFRKERREAHCLYLEILAETGLVGFVPYSILISYMFVTLFRVRRKAKERGDDELERLLTALIVSLSGLLAGYIFLHDAWPRFTWLLIGIAFSTANLFEEEDRKTEIVGDEVAQGLALR